VCYMLVVVMRSPAFAPVQRFAVTRSPQILALQPRMLVQDSWSADAVADVVSSAVPMQQPTLLLSGSLDVPILLGALSLLAIFVAGVFAFVNMLGGGESAESKTSAPQGGSQGFDAPQLDLPKIDLPQIELPKLSLPKLELPNFELPKMPELPNPLAGDDGGGAPGPLGPLGETPFRPDIPPSAGPPPTPAQPVPVISATPVVPPTPATPVAATPIDAPTAPVASAVPVASSAVPVATAVPVPAEAAGSSAAAVETPSKRSKGKKKKKKPRP